jgi:hypothetical protein
MATYSKRYKHQKSRKDTVEGANSDEKTAQLLVFYNFRRNCLKNGSFVAKIRIISVCRAVALVTIGYLVYQKFIAEPKQLRLQMKCLLHNKISTSYRRCCKRFII